MQRDAVSCQQARALVLLRSALQSVAGIMVLHGSSNGGTISSSDGCGTCSDRDPSDSSSKGGVGHQATPDGVQAHRDQGQQQDSASLSVCDKGSSWPVYGDLDRELASISSERLSKPD